MVKRTKLISFVKNTIRMESSKVFVITGTSSGLGKTLAEYFTRKGYVVYGLSRTYNDNEIFHYLKTDISDEENVTKSIQTIYEKHKRIDVVINNAGIGMIGAVEDASKDEVNKVLNVNIFGTLFILKSVLPIMRNQRSGYILNVSSIASNNGLPFRGLYSASKSAVDRITESLRLENRNSGIEICTLNFGDIKTNVADRRVISNVSPFYEKKLNTVYKNINKEVNHGVDTEKLAPYIEKMLAKKNLKPHYYIGKSIQQFSVKLKNILPQKLFENIIAKYSKLN